MGKELRRFERFPVSYEASVHRVTKSMDPAAADVFRAHVLDMSRGGARLQMRELVLPKEQLQLTVGDQNVGFGLDVSAVVRWSQKITGGYETGLEFTRVRKFALQAGDTKPAANPGP